MYNGIGLQTARGSGTNGYVQTNKFFVRAKTGRVTDSTKGFEAGQGTAGVSRKPNKEILEHERKRQIQLKLVVLEDKLIDQGYTEAEIAEKLEEARKTLEDASASEEGRGLGAIASDAKVSETETHKIAARKEKQMEMFRAALGIGTPDANEQGAEGSDDAPKNDRNNASSDDKKWHEKSEHSFLDREHVRKRCVIEDGEIVEDDVKMIVKDVKTKKDETRRLKGDSRRRIHLDDSSDSDSSSKHVKRTSKKHRKGRRRSGRESDTDTDSRKKRRNSLKKHKKSRKDSSDSSDSSSSSSDTGKVSSSEDAGKVSSSEDTDKVSSKKEIEKYGKHHRRHDSDDSDLNEDSSKHRSQKGKQNMKASVHHDSDISSEMEKKRNHFEKRSNQLGGSHKGDRENFDVKHHQKSDNDRYGKRRRAYDVDGADVIKRRAIRNDTDDDSDIKIEKYSRSRRHDSDDENSDSSHGKKIHKASPGWPKAIENKPPSNVDKENSNRYRSDLDKGSSDSDSDSSASDYRHKRSGKNSVEKNRSGSGDDMNGRSVQSGQGHMPAGSDKKRGSGRHDDITFDTPRKLEERSLYQSRRDVRDKERSTCEHQEMRMSKRKYGESDRDEQPEARLRSKIVVKDADHKGHHSDTKTESELNTRSRGNKDDWDNKEHARARRYSRDGEDPRGGRHRKADEEDRKYRRDGKDDEELLQESRRRGRGEEEERRSQRHGKAEEEEQGSRRHGRWEEEEQGSRRHGRWKEEERGSKGNERENQGYSSKRVRYDDTPSSERKRYEYKRDDDRGRRRD